MRARSRSSDSARVRRACAAISSSADCTVCVMLRCTVATSLTDSAIMRVSSWKRVKRSISSGSNSTDELLLASRRDAICVSACSSMSRSWRRRRSRFSVSSRSDDAHLRDVALETRTRDRDFAGLVDQAVEQRRLDAHRGGGRIAGGRLDDALHARRVGGAEARPVDRGRRGVGQRLGHDLADRRFGHDGRRQPAPAATGGGGLDGRSLGSATGVGLGHDHGSRPPTGAAARRRHRLGRARRLAAGAGIPRRARRRRCAASPSSAGWPNGRPRVPRRPTPGGAPARPGASRRRGGRCP